ncbi:MULTISPECIES: nitroreductase family protein [Paenibacillus]|jgi:predicted oxidoreductase (fatty acid repression mutant protein)|uniref:Nitroreductase n=2 Tax=Paenibacillus TaxID=44249 RepID=A0A1R1F299_9BACL|nr:MULTISPECIES: nitroreductase family protein [Paenibacillus]MBJ9990476.1 nitroreductase family protein [Paenibacillus sp. S28]MEC0173532.1 nitroreductase family protein [Paenibacillus favisporus]OMF58239.1 nitroreductase [Paenibacillus rhizosphaerae]PQP89403.1 nitroreductase [Paenibacillus sp. AR247]UYO03393.1 nitroreductase family protein [Paenibacillus sp. PSB04]
MSKQFIDALKNRRSIYGISKEQVISDEKIQEIVNDAVKYTPSSFNSQSTRVVVLLGEQHDKLWNVTENVLKAVVPADSFAPTAEKMAAFRAGYGTILFFEDYEVIEGLQASFPSYADNFPVWSHHTSAMHQLVIWTALEAEGLGASLQHYNPLIDQKVAAEWNIPASWKLIAQMPFGKPTVQPGEKEFKPLEDRVKVFK